MYSIEGQSLHMLLNTNCEVSSIIVHQHSPTKRRIFVHSKNGVDDSFIHASSCRCMQDMLEWVGGCQENIDTNADRSLIRRSKRVGK